MKNHILSSTFTVVQKKSNKQSNQDKEKYNALNKMNSNNIKESKNQNKMNHVIKHIKFNSTKGASELKISLDINKDNNLENNNSSQNNQSKDLVNSVSMCNLEDLDEKLDIKLPYSINNNIANTSITSQGTKNPTFNIRAKIIGDKAKSKKINIMPTKLNEKRNSNNNDNLKENLFNTYNKLINKANNFLANFNDKNKYAQNKKKENKKNNNNNSINIFSNIINKKKYRSIEGNDLEKDSYMDNGIHVNINIKNKHMFPTYYNQNYKATFENEHINRKNNNMFYQRQPGYYIKKIQKNSNKDFINFINNISNKRFYSVNKRDLNNEFRKNHHYIQKVMDNIQPNNNKKINNKLNNFNHDYKKSIKNNFYISLANKDNNDEDNNIDNIFNRDNKFLINNFLKNESSNNKTINNNGTNVFLKNNKINNGDMNNIKTVRASRFLSVEKQKTVMKPNNNDNMIYEKKIIEENKNINNHTFYNGFYNYNSKTKKSSSIKSAYISIKLKNFTEFIFNIYNRKFRHLLISFLDIKSLVYLSSTSSDFFRNTRNFLYLYFYNNLITDKNKDKFINKVLYSAKIFCSEKIKLKIKNHEFKPFYEKLKKKNEIYDDLILKDIPRTIPGDNSFSIGKHNYNKLYRILTCFSNYNKKIGYAQGINFIIANAIYFFNSEEEVFLFFEGFINLLKMDNFFGEGNSNKLINKFTEFNAILNKHIPDIIKFLNDKQVSHDFFTTKWILTLFSTSLERSYLVIVWCFMIIFNWKFTYSYIIQILKKYKDNIFNSSENQLCFKMKNILDSKEFKNDFNEIILNTINFMKNNITI